MTQWGLDTLFNPAKRHMDEEKRRLQTTREQVGDSSGGRRVDLESGKVKIQRPESDNDTGDPGDAAEAATKPVKHELEVVDPNSARARARLRRQAKRSPA
jgi:Family of unknown function (DUF6191)